MKRGKGEGEIKKERGKERRSKREGGKLFFRLVVKCIKKEGWMLTKVSNAAPVEVSSIS